MSNVERPLVDDQLLRDVLAGLSQPAHGSAVSVGIVGSTRHPPQPPRTCLQHCLDGDPQAIDQHGCAFLRHAAAGQVNPDALQDGRCPQGFAAVAQPASLGADHAIFVTLDSSRTALPQLPHLPPEHALRGHMDRAVRVVQRIGELVEENAGFANEVLQNYEQLNLVFDLTQQIAEITDATAIESLLLQRLARLLAVDTIVVIGADGARRAYGPNEPLSVGAADLTDIHPQAVAELRTAVQRARQVNVTVAQGHQVLAGPLIRLDQKVDVVFAVRSSRTALFHSGEMMLTESLLAFGGQIIANTELHERMRHMSLQVTRAMIAAVDKKDHYTSNHSERVGFLTRITAQEMGVAPAELEVMEWAGLLHDVGKIGIPEEILSKPGKLTPEEFEIIKGHPRMGYEILRPIASLGVILDGVLYHHEYPDGSGYPAGLKGDEIPLVARIVHVADTFDALTSTRSYRKAFSVQRAIEIIVADSGTRIDRAVGEAFIRAFKRFRASEPENYRQRFANLIETEEEHVAAPSA